MRLGRQRSGSTVCPSCGRLVGVNDRKCFSCGRPAPGLWGFAPVLRRLGGDFGFAEVVIGACTLLYLLTLLADPSALSARPSLSFLAPSGRSLIVFGASGPLPVFQLDRWWTVLSAGWLHGSLIHILFNMMWVRQLAPATAAVYGGSRTVVIYVLSSVVGFVSSSVGGAYLGVFSWILGGAPGSYTVGASAAIFGLLGAVVYAGRRGVASDLARQAWVWAALLFVLGIFLRGVDNWAHLGGFAGGFVVARFLDPLRAERFDDTLAAGVCLVLSAAAVVVSALTAM